MVYSCLSPVKGTITCMCSKHSGSQQLRQCVCVLLVSVCYLCLCATGVCVLLVSLLWRGAARLPLVDVAGVC